MTKRQRAPLVLFMTSETNANGVLTAPTFDPDSSSLAIAYFFLASPVTLPESFTLAMYDENDHYLLDCLGESLFRSEIVYKFCKQVNFSKKGTVLYRGL